VLEEDGEVSGKVWVRGLEVYDRCYIWSVTLSTCTSSRNNITYRISAQSQEHRPAPVSPVAWSAHTSQQLQHKPQRRRKASIPWWRLNGGKISKERLHLHRNHPRGLPRTLIPAEHASQYTPVFALHLSSSHLARTPTPYDRLLPSVHHPLAHCLSLPWAIHQPLFASATPRVPIICHIPALTCHNRIQHRSRTHKRSASQTGKLQ
jgi:hypothetical protein